MPWQSFESLSDGLEIELQKEANSKHILFNTKVKAVGRRFDCDDVLFKIVGTEKFALVHLTWRMKKEESPTCPDTIIYNDWTEVFQKVIIPDNQEYEL